MNIYSVKKWKFKVSLVYVEDQRIMYFLNFIDAGIFFFFWTIYCDELSVDFKMPLVSILSQQSDYYNCVTGTSLLIYNKSIYYKNDSMHILWTLKTPQPETFKKQFSLLMCLDSINQALSIMYKLKTHIEYTLLENRIINWTFLQLGKHLNHLNL